MSRFRYQENFAPCKQPERERRPIRIARCGREAMRVLLSPVGPPVRALWEQRRRANAVASRYALVKTFVIA